ncbi:DUF4136 domain-containing protein [Haliea sp. E17]|uniref:DUF4136 domain-containing protein n=1 Tax=Haliea sp. E17 TaxID=3401576 RepID=UPI003AAD4B64
MSSRLLQFLSIVCVMLFVSACASGPQAVMDFDHDYDFSRVKTIAIQPFDRTKVTSIAISDMQVDRINAAITAELESKGYQVIADTPAADLLLTWHLVTQDRTDVRTYDGMSYYNCWRCGPAVSDVSVRQYTEGTLIVDMIDPERTRSVWRSVIQSELKPQPDADKAAARRKKAAELVFAGFPPEAASN